jgi:hypothetical protein
MCANICLRSGLRADASGLDVLDVADVSGLCPQIPAMQRYVPANHADTLRYKNPSPPVTQDFPTHELRVQWNKSACQVLLMIRPNSTAH